MAKMGPALARLRGQELQKHDAGHANSLRITIPKGCCVRGSEAGGSHSEKPGVNKTAAHHCQQALDDNRLRQRLLNKQMLLLFPVAEAIAALASDGSRWFPGYHTVGRSNGSLPDYIAPDD